MHRILLAIVSAAVGAVAGYGVPKLVGRFRNESPTLIPFPTLRPNGRSRRGQATGVQPTNNGPDLIDTGRDDR